MSQFEFLFSLYGLLLGLGVAELAAGFSRAYDKRKTQSIGWLAPGLAALLICDLLTFWAGAWRFRDAQVTYYLMLAATAVGLIYYFAASQVWPREGSAEAADDHAMARRRLIALSIFVINLAVFFAPTAAEWIAGDDSAWLANAMNAVYVAALAWLFFAPTRRQAALAAWFGVAFLITAVGILS